jgi:hypothetical protein
MSEEQKIIDENWIRVSQLLHLQSGIDESSLD